MEGAGDEDQTGKIETNAGDTPTRLQGEDEGVAQASFDEAEKARRLANLPQGNTKSGHGKLRTVTTKAGDTLWKLAERKDIYGSGWLYPLILKANQDVIKDPNHLEIGLKLKIPRDVPAVQEEIAKE
jgi:nucleoid-associated protein YgaU